MTDDDRAWAVIQARQASEDAGKSRNITDRKDHERITDLIAAVRAEATLAEREACAKVADAVSQQFTSRHNDIAAAIRARSATHDVEEERG